MERQDTAPVVNRIFADEMAKRLKKRFPWLGTDKSIDFRDECIRLAKFYAELKAEAKKTAPKPDSAFNTRIRKNVMHALITDLWWFVENVTDETVDRTDQFFSLRERVREYQSSLKAEVRK